MSNRIIVNFMQSSPNGEWHVILFRCLSSLTHDSHSGLLYVQPTGLRHPLSEPEASLKICTGPHQCSQDLLLFLLSKVSLRCPSDTSLTIVTRKAYLAKTEGTETELVILDRLNSELKEVSVSSDDTSISDTYAHLTHVHT